MFRFSRLCRAGTPAPLPPVSLQLLFADKGSGPLSTSALKKGLETYNDDFKSVELLSGETPAGEAGLTAAAKWTVGRPDSASRSHRVDIIVREQCPLPPSVFDRCVRYALYAEEMKEKMSRAANTVFLTYHSEDDARVSPLEQYAAVCAVAGSLADLTEAEGVLNVNASTSAPALLFRKAFVESKQGSVASATALFEKLPLTTIFCGFVRYEREKPQGVDGVAAAAAVPELLFRTHGAEILRLPNWVAFAPQEASDVVFSTFHALWEFAKLKENALAAEQTVQLTPDAQTAIHIRAPNAGESYMEDPWKSVLILEPVHGWEALRVQK